MRVPEWLVCLSRLRWRLSFISFSVDYQYNASTAEYEFYPYERLMSKSPGPRRLGNAGSIGSVVVTYRKVSFYGLGHAGQQIGH